MNNFFQQLKKEALNTKLSPDEKQTLRMALYDAMAHSRSLPAIVSPVQPAKSPYVFISLFHVRALVPLSIALVVLVGSGTAYAAQGALPGDLLYPVKTQVNEQVEVALATTPTGKAVAEARIAERRVAEAQTLDAQGRLDATTTQEIEDNFNEHASRALAFRAESFVATTSATSSTSIENVGAQLQDGEGLNAPRVMTSVKLATTTPEVLPRPALSEVQTTEGSLQESEDNFVTSLQIQKNILNELKLRIERRGRSGANTDNRNSGDNRND